MRPRTRTPENDPDPRHGPLTDRPTLCPDAPADLLAEARLGLGGPLRDALLLIGHDGTGDGVLVTRSPLRHLVDGGPDQLEHHLAALCERGCRGALGVIVLGDGYDPVPAGVVSEVTEALGPLVLATAEGLLPDPLPVDPLWVLADGSARRLVVGGRDAEGLDVLVSPPEPLTPFECTASAARAVLAGTPVGLPGLARDLQRAAAEVLGSAEHRPAEGPLPDLPVVLARSRAVLARWRRASVVDPMVLDPGFVTDCERLGDLLVAVGPDGGDWDLLGLAVAHPGPVRIAPEALLGALVEDPALRPHCDVHAGGAWFEDLRTLRELAAALAAEGSPRARRTGLSAWRSLSAVLVLLSWWNHRYASAGELVDELREEDPASTLAPLLSRLIDTPIPPAWGPRG